MKLAADTAGKDFLVYWPLVENVWIEASKNHLGGGGGVMFLVHGYLVLVPEFTDFLHAETYNIFIELFQT